MNISAISNCGVLSSNNKQNFTANTLKLSQGEFTLINTRHVHDILGATDTEHQCYWYCRKPDESVNQIKSKIRRFEKENKFSHNDGYWTDKRFVHVEKVVDINSQDQHINLHA